MTDPSNPDDPPAPTGEPTPTARPGPIDKATEFLALHGNPVPC